MMVIPENLPLEVAPLAWMLGSWHGWGMITTPDGDQPVLETVEATVVDTHVQMVTSIFAASTDHDLDPTLDAEAGLSVLAQGPLLRRETLEITVKPGTGMPLPLGEVEPRELDAHGVEENGGHVTWVGMSLGPRVQFSSDTAATSSHLSRLYGLVGGEMMWTQEIVTEDGEMDIDLTGRLARVMALDLEDISSHHQHRDE